MKFDLVVAYRIYPGISKTPAIYPQDKWALSEAAFASFIRGCGKLNVKIVVLLDKCPEEYKQIFTKYVSPKQLVFRDYPGVGNGATFGEQTRILLEQNDAEQIFFCEDDYFFLDNSIEKLLECQKIMKEAHFLTPYDHLDYYIRGLQDYTSEIQIAGNLHWRTVATTCMTFLTTKSILRETLDIFLTYTRNNYDASLWSALTKKIVVSPHSFLADEHRNEVLKIYVKAWLYCWRQILFGKKYKLWAPMPSLATHLEKTCLAPSIDWDAEFQRNGIIV